MKTKQYIHIAAAALFISATQLSVFQAVITFLFCVLHKEHKGGETSENIINRGTNLLFNIQ